MRIFLPAIYCAGVAILLSQCSILNSEEPRQNSSKQRLIPPLSPDEKNQIAQIIWQNECAGSVSGLVSWNAGEEFPSLGIAHFIWFPKSVNPNFEESFPAFIQFAERRGANPPKYAFGACPWPNRQAFQVAVQNRDERIAGLRRWLASTTNIQADFVVARLQNSLTKIIRQSENPTETKQKIQAIAGSTKGIFALIDYINFKGDGLNPAERYQGEGWGLMQVLENMPISSVQQSNGNISSIAARKAFSKAAILTLENRVRLSPKARGESRWLAGWTNRCQSYAR